MKITPHVNLLKSLRGDRIDYVLLAGEGIDNAFDANATSVAVSIDSERITFKDNGVGIDRDHLPAVFSLGNHGHMSTTQLGRFGIGIKAQAVNAGNTLYVESISKDGHFSIDVNWQKILRSAEWEIDEPRWRLVVIGRPTGTMISIGELRKPPRIDLPKIATQIALRFHPAIADGKAISLNEELIDRLPEPALTDVIEKQLQLSEGRGANIRAGVLSQASKLHHIHIGYGHRVIMPESSLGCGQYGGLNRMFARVQLYGKWHLAKFKDDLTDEEERDELEEAIGEALKPILEKCSSSSMSAKIVQMGHALNDLIPQQFSAARPKPGPKKPPGPKRPRKPGIIDHDKAEEGGPAKSRRPPDDKFLITFDGNADEVGVGGFQYARPHRVNLSKDDPDVAMFLEHRDQKFGVRALYVIAVSLFLEGLRRHNPQLELPLEGTFGQQIAKLLAMQADTDVNRIAS